MSFILDALRKSETERQRQSGPGLVDAGYRPPARRRALWVPVLLVVLLANLVVMGFLWLRREPAPAAPPVTAGAPAAESPVAAAPPPAGRALAAAAGVSTVPEEDYAAVADLPALDGGPVTEVLEPPADDALATADAAVGPPSAIRDGLPTAAQLMASGAIPPSDLHLDIHVWSDVPAERFVFINMRKYGEGAEVAQGTRIEEITQDGVVLSQGGQRFVLNRD